MNPTYALLQYSTAVVLYRPFFFFTVFFVLVLVRRRFCTAHKRQGGVSFWFSCHATAAAAVDTPHACAIQG